MIMKMPPLSALLCCYVLYLVACVLDKLLRDWLHLSVLFAGRETAQQYLHLVFVHLGKTEIFLSI